MKRYGPPRSIVTDRLRSYRAAMKVVGVSDRQECGRWLNNRAENSHQPFRRREGAMAKFREVKALQKSAVVHASIHNHFSQDRHLNRRDIFRTEPFRRPGRVAAAGGLSASDRRPSQAGSGLSDSASVSPGSAGTRSKPCCVLKNTSIKLIYGWRCRESRANPSSPISPLNREKTGNLREYRPRFAKSYDLSHWNPRLLLPNSLNNITGKIFSRTGN